MLVRVPRHLSQKLPILWSLQQFLIHLGSCPRSSVQNPCFSETCLSMCFILWIAAHVCRDFSSLKPSLSLIPSCNPNSCSVHISSENETLRNALVIPIYHHFQPYLTLHASVNVTVAYLDTEVKMSQKSMSGTWEKSFATRWVLFQSTVLYPTRFKSNSHFVLIAFKSWRWITVLHVPIISRDFISSLTASIQLFKVVLLLVL